MKSIIKNVKTENNALIIATFSTRNCTFIVLYTLLALVYFSRASCGVYEENQFRDGLEKKIRQLQVDFEFFGFSSGNWAMCVGKREEGLSHDNFSCCFI